MLLVKTRTGPSGIHGTGLFAAEPIAKGQAVWRFTPNFDLEREPSCLDTVTAAQRAYLLHYGYLDPRLGRFVLCCDDARYINHSAAANIAPEFGEDPRGIDRAARDIAEGEEITADYRLVEGASPDALR